MTLQDSEYAQEDGEAFSLFPSNRPTLKSIASFALSDIYLVSKKEQATTIVCVPHETMSLVSCVG